MKKLFLIPLIIVQSCIAFAQSSCVNDTIVREIQFPMTERDTETVFFYFNNEWIRGADPGLVPPDSIQKAQVKNDEYGNRALFLTVSPETLAQIKAEARKIWVYDDARCEFPEAMENSKNGLMKIFVFPKDSRVAKEYLLVLPFILTAQSVSRRFFGARAKTRL